MMDRDYPMTRRQVKVLVVGLVAMAVFWTALFGGLIPGLHPNYASPPIATYDGRPYYWEALQAPYPLWPTNSTSPTNATFHNATVSIRAIDWYDVGGGRLVGNVTTPNGSVYPYVLAAFAPTFTTPGGEVVLDWPGGLLYEILVLAPTSTG